MSEPRPRLARHSDPTLLALEQLRATLRDDATEQDRDGWWPLVLKVQSWIDGDPRASKADHDAMRRLREGVSEVYGTLNRGHEPSYSAATRAITGLQNILEVRTTGFDGHRLR
jgi:hypothetical protein